VRKDIARLKTLIGEGAGVGDAAASEGDV